MKWSWLPGVLLMAGALPLSAQVEIRLGDPARADYSELHEGLRRGTPVADSIVRLLRSTDVAALWRVGRGGLDGGDWDAGLLALTRLAELRVPAFADSAAQLRRRIESGAARAPGGHEASDLIEPLKAVGLELRRAREGDQAVRADILARVPAADYGVADAWVLGRMRDGTADTLAARFLAATGVEPKVRYLTLLAFSTDSTQVPLLARVYVAPDSFGVPVRYGMRASDALLWIGTRTSFQALRDARTRARARGAYADPHLMRGGYDFLTNDSSAVISRTGRWLDEWLGMLK